MATGQQTSWSSRSRHVLADWADVADPALGDGGARAPPRSGLGRRTGRRGRGRNGHVGQDAQVASSLSAIGMKAVTDRPRSFEERQHRTALLAWPPPRPNGITVRAQRSHEADGPHRFAVCNEPHTPVAIDAQKRVLTASPATVGRCERRSVPPECRSAPQDGTRHRGSCRTRERFSTRVTA